MQDGSWSVLTATHAQSDHMLVAPRAHTRYMHTACIFVLYTKSSFFRVRKELPETSMPMVAYTTTTVDKGEQRQHLCVCFCQHMCTNMYVCMYRVVTTV